MRAVRATPSRRGWLCCQKAERRPRSEACVRRRELRSGQATAGDGTAQCIRIHVTATLGAVLPSGRWPLFLQCTAMRRGVDDAEAERTGRWSVRLDTVQSKQVDDTDRARLCFRTPLTAVPCNESAAAGKNEKKNRAVQRKRSPGDQTNRRAAQTSRPTKERERGEARKHTHTRAAHRGGWSEGDHRDG